MFFDVDGMMFNLMDCCSTCVSIGMISLDGEIDVQMPRSTGGFRTIHLRNMCHRLQAEPFCGSTIFRLVSPLLAIRMMLCRSDIDSHGSYILVK